MYPFYLTYSFSRFFLITFLILNSFWFGFCNSFFVKRSDNFLSIKVTNNIRPWHCIFNFFNHKKLFRSICKSKFIFSYFSIIINFKFRISVINFFTRVNICVSFYIKKFHFNCAMMCIIVFINYIILFININFFWNWSHIYIDFSFSKF